MCLSWAGQGAGSSSPLAQVCGLLQIRWCAGELDEADDPVPGADSTPHSLITCQNSWRKARLRTPAVGVLFHVLIGEHRFESATVEVESQHISSRESALWQHGEEEFVDDSFTGASDATLGRSGGMSGNHDPAAGALWADDEVRTVVEQTCCSAFRMDGLLIRGKLEASLHFCPIEEAIVSAPHHKGQVCQIVNDRPIAILAIETDEGR
jgi:hypothetical protein